MKTKNMYSSKKWVKPVAIKVLLAFTAQIMYPTVSFALTSGPQQPEANNFTPADVSNLVDPFTGDFSYNIPMFDIGGYPVNLSYSSGISMDQEATWTGLGWNLNTGAITRDVRGLPDDFWGDEVTRKFNTKKNITAGGSVTVGAEFVGVPLSLSFGLQMKYNNYTGFSVGQTVNGGLSFGNAANVGLGLSTTNGGLDINPNISFSSAMGNGEKSNYTGTLGFGLNINSRTGLSQMSLNASVSTSSPNGTTNKYKNGDKKESRQRSQTNKLGSTGGSISFLNPTYTPQLGLPYENFNFSGRFQIGGAVAWADLNGTIGGFYSEQHLMTNATTSPAYGYVYSEKGQTVDNALHDFNREKDGPFTINTPTLPLTNYTYDAFNIKAQGIGGSFRAFRNDVGHVFDQDMYNPSYGGSFGAEVELGNAVDFGFDINVNWNESKTGKWKSDNPAKDQLRFRQPVVNELGENVFFKLVGEKVSESDPSFKTRIQSDAPVAVGLEDANDPMSLNKLVSNSGTTTLNNNNYRSNNSRMIRNTLVQCLTLAEVKKAYPVYMKYMPGCAKDHHIVMIIVTTADGTRYVFGLPAYNKTKKEVTFAVGQTINNTVGLTNNPATNLVTYGSMDASVHNQRGIDNYYDETTTPAYVYTWYLTEVLSPDYSDITGDGPSADDLGGYVLFQYGIRNANGTIQPNVSDFQWRTPSTGTSNQATFSEGLKSLKTDNKATYIYGTKDIWYPNSMESKTQTVVFDYSDRLDGMGVTGEHGAVGGTKQKRIDKIRIFSRPDYMADSTTAIPLKTIHFEYDYSLCPNTPNSSATEKGKLTLKKVYFTYRNSYKAKYSAYSFNYPSGTTGNPGYDPTASDRWGSYRSNSDNLTLGIPRNEDFPYTYQDSATANKYARCWNLNKITLPTGGEISIEYQADDYAYVQNKKACDMFRIIGAGPDSLYSSISDNLYTSSDPNEFLFFTLEEPVSGSLSLADANKYVKEHYFNDPNEPEQNGPHKYLYFRFLTNVNNGNEDPAWEYVGGYADVSSGVYCGVVPGHYGTGWVRLKSLPTDGGAPGAYNPISKAGWAFSRIHTPFYANGQPVPGQSDPGDFLKTILNADLMAQLVDFFSGPNNKLRNRGFSSKFIINSSYIRLYDPNGVKYGGGHRVSKIKISDQWEEMESSEESFVYGQEYKYTLTDDPNSKSSGVAAYEPMYGADENPFRIPVFYDQEYGPLIPDDRFYQEEPFGEGFFPAPSVGYSRVKIMNLQRPNVTHTATGHTIKEFYTAKDFPTITRRTKMDQKRAKINPILAIFSPYTFDFQTVSQGFSIELNDMHGKPKREAVYQEGNTQEPISKVEHFYKVETLSTHEINNEVPVLNQDGTVSTREIGTEIDMVSDFRESSSSGGNINVGINIDYMQAGPIPLIIPMVYPEFKFEDTRFRSASVTKVINRYGIEMKTEAYDLGSKVMTENKLFNGISGEVISTRVNNEYEDERYTMSIPAYWAYDGMKQASTNAGFVMQSTMLASTIDGPSATYPGRITIGGTSPYMADYYFEPGDEVFLYEKSSGRSIVPIVNSNSNHFNRLWVARNDADGYLYFINNHGAVYIPPSTYTNLTFKIIRSGHRNILAPKIMEMASLDAPVDDFNSGGNYVTVQKPLSVSALTYNEQWKNLKRFDLCTPYSQCVCSNKGYVNNLLLVLQTIINTNKEFVDYGVTLYDSGVYYYPIEDSTMIYMTSIFNPYIVTVLRFEVAINSYPVLSSYYPSQDVGFVNSTDSLPLIFKVVGLDASGDTIVSEGECNAAYKIQLSSSSIYYNQTSFNCDSNSSTQSSPVYIPVVINGNYYYLLFSFLYPYGWELCSLLRDCEIFEYTHVDNNIGDPVNPYIHNILGKWRPYETYTLLQDRYSSMDKVIDPGSGSTNIPDLRNDGYIKDFTEFWRINSGLWTYASYDDVLWKRTVTMTQYHPSGVQIEEKNALNIYSSALYGYYEQLPLAVVQNAEYKEIGYDGFEDYAYIDNTNPYTYTTCSSLTHFKFDDYKTDLDSTQSHTGKRSLKVNDASAIMERPTQSVTGYRTTRNVPYLLTQDDMIEYFGPVASTKEYIFSFWVKQDNYTPITFDYTDVSGDIKIGTTSLLTSGSLKKSPIIEGWQRFEYRFVIGTTPGVLKIELIADGVTAYFDDVRIHPVNGSMKSYVYDPVDLRFMAELDENNYATFYEYDEDGALIRVKKETERGVMTIQENRYGSYKQ